ncbi:MAG: hypothetical protein IPL22_16515 [Bacteroidetes bacterium]|nr:hypothetical protein [Bacteroidota bacterium]
MLTTEEGYVIAKINPSTGVSIWWNEINNPVAYPTATVKDMVIDAADNITLYRQLQWWFLCRRSLE